MALLIQLLTPKWYHQAHGPADTASNCEERYNQAHGPADTANCEERYNQAHGPSDTDSNCEVISSGTWPCWQLLTPKWYHQAHGPADTASNLARGPADTAATCEESIRHMALLTQCLLVNKLTVDVCFTILL